MTMQSGTRLGPYEIVAPIGAGGMGEVYKARDTRLDRSVAIKILPTELAQNVQFRIRFEREAKTISKLSHPNICALFDVGENYIVMELLEGESLADRLAKGPLPLSEVFKYGAQISEALGKAHHEGVIHRDLKPGNVMITKSGAKLLDFGLAKSGGQQPPAVDATEAKPLTKEGTIVGTFQYMAPEQLAGEQPDARTDIFALGVLLYETATGKRAFEGKSKTSLIAAIMSAEPKPMSQLQPLTPPALEHVVKKCLAKDPDDRWQNASDIAEELRWISEVGSQAGVAVPVAARKRSRERLAWLLAAILAATAAALSVFYEHGARQAARVFVFDINPPAGMRFNAVGDESGAMVVSPDGALAVYSATNGSTPQLWLRSIVTGEAKAIAGTEGGTFPFWSPDSRKIGFFTLGRLKTVTNSVGAPVIVCDAAASRGGSWGKDDWIVFTPDTQSPIFRVRAFGGAPQKITTIEIGKHTSHRWPAFLPDGKHFLYLAANHQDPTGGANGIYITSIEGEPSRLVTPSVSNAIYKDGYLLFSREQTLFGQRMASSGILEGEPIPIAENVLFDGGIWRGAFSVADNGLLLYHTGRASIVSTLRWVDRTGKDVGTVGETASFWDVELSPDGQKLVVPTGDPLRELWIHDLRRNTRTRLPIEQSWAGAAVFSPDSSTLYVDILRNGRNELIARRVNGGGEKLLLSLGTGGGGTGVANVTSISPDGKVLLLDTQDGHLARVPLAPVAQPVRLLQGKAHDAGGQFSPDGKWIAYVSDQNGRSDVFVMSSSDPNQKWQISNSGGISPRWRRDSKEIFYLDPANKLTAVPVETSGNDLVVGTEQSLFAFAPRPQCMPYDVAANGQRFLVNAVAAQESPAVVVVSNWKSSLKR